MKVSQIFALTLYRALYICYIASMRKIKDKSIPNFTFEILPYFPCEADDYHEFDTIQKCLELANLYYSYEEIELCGFLGYYAVFWHNDTEKPTEYIAQFKKELEEEE